jgi:hypothetical protein
VGPSALPERRGTRVTLRTAGDLFSYVSTSMPLPQSKVGTLTSREYWDVVDFILRAQGVELPERGLSAANADEIPLH